MRGAARYITSINMRYYSIISNDRRGTILGASGCHAGVAKPSEQVSAPDRAEDSVGRVQTRVETFAVFGGNKQESSKQS